jgi:hypothetical protein
VRHIVSLSGGKDSTALALYLRQRSNLTHEYVFADTGRELPGLYEFIDRLSTLLGNIIRIFDGWHCRDCNATGTDPKCATCSRCGSSRIEARDMDYYMKRWSTETQGPFLPGASGRWCTKHLKLRPFERFIGKDEATIYIGIRSDEHREGNYGGYANITYRYPFVEDCIDLAGVYRILEDADITLPDYYDWRHTGGCWCCPFQRPEDWAGLKDNHPELYDLARAEESRSAFKWSSTGQPLDVVVKRGYERKRQRKFDFLADDHTLEDACLICSK